MGSARLVEQPPRRRRSARRPPRGFGLRRFRIQVGEDLLDDLRILDARDDPHRPAAGRTGLDIDPEDPLEALRPGHCGAAFGWRRLLRVRGPGMRGAPAPPGRGHPRTVFAVRCEHPVETGQVHPRLGHQGGQPGNEIQWLEDDVRRAVSVRRLQLVSDLAVRCERQALFRDRRPADVPAPPLELLALIRPRRHANVQ